MQSSGHTYVHIMNYQNVFKLSNIYQYMKSRLLFISGTAILGLSIIFSLYLTIPQDSGLSPDLNTQLKKCNTLIYNGPEKVNIVYIGNKDSVIKYSEFFLETPPFNERKKDFNIYYVDSDPECRIYKGVAVLCDDATTFSTAGSCPNDVIIALKNLEDNTIRSSAYNSLISINTRHSMTVQTHELGHAISNLAEEYLNNQKPPKNSVNCATTCADFNGLEDSCDFAGCSLSNLLRPSENSVMRTLSTNDYNKVSTSAISNSLSKKLSKKSPLTGFVVEDENPCQEEKYFLVTGQLNPEGNLILEPTLITGCSQTDISTDKELTLEVNSQEGYTNTNSINDFIFTDVQYDGEDIISGEVLDLDVFRFTIPSNSEEIVLKDQEGNNIGELILDKSEGTTLCKK